MTDPAHFITLYVIKLIVYLFPSLHHYEFAFWYYTCLTDSDDTLNLFVVDHQLDIGMFMYRLHTGKYAGKLKRVQVLIRDSNSWK